MSPRNLGFTKTNKLGNSHQPYARHLSLALTDSFDRTNTLRLESYFSSADLEYLRQLHTHLAKNNTTVKFENTPAIRTALDRLY
jgi:hypothetical protein